MSAWKEGYLEATNRRVVPVRPLVKGRLFAVGNQTALDSSGWGENGGAACSQDGFR